jgi:hypothetical protein
MWTYLEKGRVNCKYVLLFFFFHVFHPCIVIFKCLGINSKLPKLGFLHTIQMLSFWHAILFYNYFILFLFLNIV